jgi:hypothetical protein
MLDTRGRQARRALFAVACCLAAPAFASDTQEQALRLDQSVQALKDEVLEFNRAAQAIENDVLLPPHARVSVYLSLKVSGFLLDEVSVMIDDRRPEVYHYDESDARALLATDSLQRLARMVVPPGAHRIRATFSGNFADAKESDPPVTGEFEAVFDKQQSEAELELVIERERRFGGKPRLTMKQWRAKP